MKKLILFLLILSLCNPSHAIVSAESNHDLKAAFIKDDNLWIKLNNKEMKITNGKYVRFPKWSHDGDWSAYISGVKSQYGSLYEGELWIFNVKKNKKFKVSSNVNNNFQWAPIKN